MPQITVSANAVAWYGAIVATLSVIISGFYLLYSILRDRRKIVVKIKEGIIIPSVDSEVKIFIDAINTGNKTVSLSRVGFGLKNKTGAHIFPKPGTWQLPYDLKPGKNVSAWIDKQILLDDLRKYNTEIIYAWYSDGTGKLFKKKYNLKP